LLGRAVAFVENSCQNLSTEYRINIEAFGMLGSIQGRQKFVCENAAIVPTKLNDKNSS
jgi:hypothetical protein